MNYCPHCNTNYAPSTAVHVCTTNTSEQLVGLRERIAQLESDNATLRAEHTATYMAGVAEARGHIEALIRAVDMRDVRGVAGFDGVTEAARKFLEATK